MEVILIALVASDILMSAEEVHGMSMLMEAGDLEEFFCVEHTTAFRGWRAPLVVRALMEGEAQCTGTRRKEGKL